MKKLSFLTLLIAILALTSCSQRLVDFTIISSKNHGLQIDDARSDRVVGESIGFFGTGASIKDAIDDALESAGPEYDLLVDGVINMKSSFITSGYVVEGTPVSSRKMKVVMGPHEFEKWKKEYHVIDPESAVVKD